jgi:hypothetical protein
VSQKREGEGSGCAGILERETSATIRQEDIARRQDAHGQGGAGSLLLRESMRDGHRFRSGAFRSGARHIRRGGCHAGQGIGAASQGEAASGNQGRNTSDQISAVGGRDAWMNSRGPVARSALGVFYLRHAIPSPQPRSTRINRRRGPTQFLDELLDAPVYRLD